MGGTEERLSPPSKGGLGPNHTVHVTAARLRIGVNVNSLVRAAARDGKR
jgi:hypothetical protein